jgi:drug/metabolite transporter (DMT)-like permease
VNRGLLYGIASAVLFGVSTPLAKVLLSSVPPLLLAGLLYAGAGVGLLFVLGIRSLVAGAAIAVPPTKRDWGWLAGAIALGGLVGPVALMFGLSTTPAASASLLLNLEAVLTALLAWFVFRENVDARIALGMLAIVAGGVLLAWMPSASGPGLVGPLLVALACACWALDNNLTRKVAASDPVLIACVKGLTAGSVNTALAMLLGTELPRAGEIAAAATVGFLGYGVSLALFVLALRHLGSARAGAYFSIAPFFGAALAILVQRDALTWQLASAGVLMGLGVWLHVTERHEHWHAHEWLAHSHSHRHDAHHQHAHDPDWDGSEPHAHPHVHEPLAHSHAHYPDVHHRHRH